MDGKEQAPTLVPIQGLPWDRVFTVSPLVLVGTIGPDGTPDLAPKHLAMPLGWAGHYGFMCVPSHATYANVVERGAFTVSFPTPSQVVETSLAATSREQDSSKPALGALATFPARVVEGVLVAGASLFLECELDRIVDGFGPGSLIVGHVVAAAADERAVRSVERDDADVVHEQPLLAYLSPGRFVKIDASDAFPFPVDFHR